MYAPYKSDWINSMDHMRISGTEPSSVILSYMYDKYASMKLYNELLNKHNSAR